MIYVLQFSRPLSHAKYYVGYCDDHRLAERIAEHRAGRGARITQVCVEQGIQLDVVMTMPGTRRDERRIKNQKNTPRLVQRYLENQQRVSA